MAALKRYLLLVLAFVACSTHQHQVDCFSRISDRLSKIDVVNHDWHFLHPQDVLRTGDLRVEPSAAGVVVVDNRDMSTNVHCTCCETYYFVADGLNQIGVKGAFERQSDASRALSRFVKAASPSGRNPIVGGPIGDSMCQEALVYQWGLDPAGEEVMPIHTEGQANDVGWSVFAWAKQSKTR